MINFNQSSFYDGSILLAEKVGNQIQKIYINDGQGIIGMVRPIYDGSNSLTHYQRLYYLYDSLGSVSAVTGEHGLPLQNYIYSPFGTCLNVTGDPINNLQFVGRYGGYLDNDTGLTYFWHRWYDSRDGRWISRDPIGIKGGINLYNYVRNRPTKFIDKKGLEDIFPDVNKIVNDYANRFGEWFWTDPLGNIWDATEDMRKGVTKFSVCMVVDVGKEKTIEAVTGIELPFLPITCMKCLLESASPYSAE